MTLQGPVIHGLASATRPTIVIGAGIGGLATAIRLAARGLPVIVLEAHGTVGGKMRAVSSPAGPVDAGPTVLTMKPVFEDLFRAAGEDIADHVTMVPETVLARHWWPDGSSLDLHADPEASARAVRDFAGASAERQFRRFSARARKLFEAFEAPMMHAPDPRTAALARAALGRPATLPALLPGRTLAGALRAAFDDPRLRQLFGRYATYVGGSPLESPALLSLIWQAEAAGVWRVEGGMHRLAAALAGLVRAKGGDIRLNAPVGAILEDAGAITGVRLRDGTVMDAARVIFAGEPRALARGHLGTAMTTLLPEVATEPRSLSAHVLAFAARPEGPRAAELTHHNLFFGRNPTSEFHDLAAGRPPGDPTLYLCAQDRGDNKALPAMGLERFEIIMNGPPTDRSLNDPDKEGGWMSDTDIGDAGALRLDVHTEPLARDTDDTGGLRPPVPRIGRFPLRAEPAWADRVPGQAKGPDGGPGPLPGRGRMPSGGRDPDGCALREARGRGDRGGPCFDIAVPTDGYAWWYVDGISADGSRAVSVIGFIGSVFSPWYRWSGRKNPANHCCINVATYGPGGRFTMTDRGEEALRLSPSTFRVGPSQMHWDGRQLIIDIDEVSGPPMISRVRGRITVSPSGLSDVELPLTEDGAHVWRPFAPTADIAVDLEAPGWQWDGHGYFDANFGTRALETDFSYWTWGRFPTEDGAICFYDATRRDGTELATGVRFAADGSARTIKAPPKTRLKRSLWQVRRETRADAGTTARQVKNMLDAPFYSRSAVEIQFAGRRTVGVHEALDLNRFRSPWLKPMLAVRVPRRRRWQFPD